MTLMPAPNEPMAVARVLIVDYTIGDCLTLRHWRGEWLRWQGSHWANDEDAARRAWLYRRLDKATYKHFTKDSKGNVTEEIRAWQPNRRKIADVLDALAATVHLPEWVDSPEWIDTKDAPFPATEIVACPNGLLHVPTRKLLDATPTFFSRVSVPFDYDPNADTPTRWLEFLAQLWPVEEGDDKDGNAEAVKTLQEFFGYALSGRTDMQKILMLIGPTRGGKGVIARTLAGLVGHGNVAAPTLPSLATNFGQQPLIGKTLAIVSDARIDGINTNQIAERLLSISGEDSVTIDRKYLPTWTGKLPTRFVVLSNELPRFGDASAAIAHRFLILPLKNSFLGKENPNLTDELRAELPGILLWALDGLDRLAEQGKFTLAKTSKEATQELVNIASPATAFVRDECELGPDKQVEVKVLFDAWKDWCEEGDHKAGDVQKFGRDLRAVMPGLKRSKLYVGGVRVPHFVGIAPKPEEPSKQNNREGRGPSRPKPATSGNAEASSRPIAAHESGDGSVGRDGPRDGSGIDAGHSDGPRWAATNPIVEPTKTETPVHEGQLLVPGTPPPEPAEKPARAVRPKCGHCKKAIPKTMRKDAKWCSKSCQQKNYKLRAKAREQENS